MPEAVDTRRRAPRRAVLVALLVAVAATALAVLAPSAQVAVHSSTLHLLLATGEALVGLLFAYLLYVRFRQTQLFNDLVLAYALILLGIADLLTAGDPDGSETLTAVFLTWGPQVTRLVAVAALAGAAFLPPQWLEPRSRAGAGVLAACTVTLAAVLWGVGVAGHWLPEGQFFAGAEGPRLTGHPAFVTVHGLIFAGFLLASAGFVRRTRRTDDALMGWFAAASVLAAAASVHFLLFPSSVRLVTSGEVLRLGFYLVLLVGAGREIDYFWRVGAELATLDERRRLARDFHDGMTQELVFLSSFSRLLSHQFRDRPEFGQLATAAERALDESRRAIHSLTSTGDIPFHEELTRAAEDMAQRAGMAVLNEIEPEVSPALPVREALIRIAREAVSNAGRHGQANTVRVSLAGPDPVVLVVEDNGGGFDPDAPQERRIPGFGLSSMRDRATRLGGEFRVKSSPGQGTTVEVVVPAQGKDGAAR